MTRRIAVAGLACALPALAHLAGCAAYEVYKKCGLSGCADDQGISVEVRQQLGQHPALEPPNLVYVHTLDHVVYLSGLVDTDLQRRMAETIASRANGVARVVNSIGLSDNR
jgi:osmotically-inducible protein OsmY